MCCVRLSKNVLLYYFYWYTLIFSYTPVKPLYDYKGLTILRSRFVHKKHRTQYEVRTYFRFMNFHRLTGSTADTFLEYIERNLPEGVALKITKVKSILFTITEIINVSKPNHNDRFFPSGCTRKITS